MWCGERQIGYGEITVGDVSDYMLFLFNSKTSSGKDYTSEALNKIRSGISFFLQYDIPRLGFEMPLTRLFTSFYKMRPVLPRYNVTWDVGIVLKFLARWHPKESLSLKQLTLKTVALVALTSSDRAQTIHALRVDFTQFSDEGLVFVIPSILKHSRKGSPPSKVVCVKWDAPELNVEDYVLYYMQKTFKYRLKSWNKNKEDSKQLFLSHRTGRPVKRASISRWIREVMHLAGIDISLFAPHSSRGASISEASRRGASPQQILSQGNWTNLGTYQRFYNREVHDTPIGRLILQASLCKFFLILNLEIPYSFFHNFSKSFSLLVPLGHSQNLINIIKILTKCELINFGWS